MTTSTCPTRTNLASTSAAARPSTPARVTEFRFDDDGSLVDLEPPTRSLGGSPSNRPGTGIGTDTETTIDLRSSDDEAIEHVVQLGSGEIVTVVGANAYQPEGPMTTFFSTGSSRGTIDSWSVRIASYRTNDIVSIQRSIGSGAAPSLPRPNLVAV